MLWKLYRHVAEVIQSCCGGYTVMLQRLYSHVFEAIRVFLLIIILPPKISFELFFVFGWVVTICTNILPLDTSVFVYLCIQYLLIIC